VDWIKKGGEMSIGKIRSVLYKTAKYLGDINAIKRAVKRGDFTPIIKRIIRRIYGYIAGRGMPK
jgi:hypothetical protein